MQKGKDISNSTAIPSLGNFFISMLNKELFIRLFPLHKPRRNDHNGLTVIMITVGEGHLKINGKDYLAHPGTLLSLLPFHLVENHYLSDDFTCKCLSYSFDFMVDFPFVLKSGISERIGNKPYLSLTTEEYNHLDEFFIFITRQAARLDHPSREEIIKALLFSFIAELSFIYSRQAVLVGTNRQKQVVDDFFRLLHQHHKQERSPSFYADKLCMTPKYLSSILKQTTDCTLYHWITNFSLQEAKVLLKSSDMSIIQISEELNYPNSSFFARFFKKHTGMTPLQFRNNRQVHETSEE
ncbi:helix-turn-helix domain-containing protein [Butyricimonas faecalis]|jgi:AraC family transcriptional regulator, transcriptional activator of pobA|uniref:AraC family transcriptional regulator n=1 Tax=Butyricimonas faecalis TaxID=2093856 RepID=A0A3Q9IQT2_9BACT|nr:response regulator transcription factor [Butyricimonas faecalis]AZS31018.1 AraC family transcriptional regulator [Butyricimonas faecalis]MBS7155306.1 helix-turn-helix transcriptional regulator [Sanguibacteroides justesenii]